MFTRFALCATVIAFAFATLACTAHVLAGGIQ